MTKFSELKTGDLFRIGNGSCLRLVIARYHDFVYVWHCEHLDGELYAYTTKNHNIDDTKINVL